MPFRRQERELPRLFVVLPCFNEEEVLPETASRLKAAVTDLADRSLISRDSRILFVNDGSADKTWELIENLHAQDAVFQGLCLSRNCGHQNALAAGLFAAARICDITVSMDADLQDDIGVVEKMVEKYREGADVVYGVRSDRNTDTLFKRTSAECFYRLMNKMGANTVYNHADCRLMSSRALEALMQFGEVNLFLRGLVPMVGFPSAVVEYERHERFAGKSKYPLSKMLHFAAEGITSLSVRPIRMITGLGFGIFFVSIAVLIYSLVRYFTGHTIPGWTTTVLSVWAIGGLIMISLGIIGEYTGKIYLESKRRPRYIVSDYLGDDGDDPVLADRCGIVS